MNPPNPALRRRVRLPAAAAGLPLFATLVAGQPAAPVELDPYEVLAHPTGADERAASVWVVARDDEAPPPTRVADLALGVPGLHIDRAGGPGGRSTIYLRGTEENHVVVFLDGVPLNDPTDSRGGGVDLSAVEPSSIRRLALVRGPASVRYGPDALAGVAHLETTGAEDTPARPRLAAEFGGQDFHRVSASGGVRLGRGGVLDLAAVDASDGTLAEGGRGRQRFFRATVGLVAPVETRLTVWHARNRFDTFPDDSGGEVFAVLRTLEVREDERTGFAARAGADWSGGRWSATVDAAQLDTSIRNPGVAPGQRDPGGLPPIDSEIRLKRFRAAVLNDGALGPDGTYAVGLDVQHEDGVDESTIFFGPFEVPAGFALERTRVGGFVEGGRDLARGVRFLGGARVDDYDDGLTRATVRGGLLGSLRGDALQWRVNAGTAFKPPSFYGLAHPIVGNPDLAPERATTLEVGLRHALAEGRGLIDFTVFRTRTRDAVDFDPGPPPRVVNIDGLRSQGAELALLLRPSATTTVSASAAFTDARSQPDGARIRSRPRWRGGLAASWRPMPALTLTAAATFVGTVPDSSIPTGDVVLGSWMRLDLGAAWRVRERLSLTLALDNALDSDHAEVVGFTTPGARLRAGVRAEF